jgi:hypothetical protein
MIRKFLILIGTAAALMSAAPPHPGGDTGDARPVVGVAKFGSDIETKFAGQITERVVDVLINSKRFQVVDRTTVEKIQAELEFQKSENFIDSKSTSQQGVMLAADFMVTGKIGAINVARVMNVDGTVGGYKASLNFTLKIVETSSTLSNEAHSFESRGGDKSLSPEKAVAAALNTIEPQLIEYFATNFPVNVRIVKILTSKKEAAAAVLVAGGTSMGLHEGDKLTVQKIELLEGKPYPTDIGEIKITKVAGENFSECDVSKGGPSLQALFVAGEKLNCKLIRK